MPESLHQSTSVLQKGGVRRQFVGGEKACPVCGVRSAGEEFSKVLYEFEKFSIVKCRKCHTKHLSPLPTAEDLAAIYNNNYYKDPGQEHGYYDYSSEAPSIEKTYRRRFDLIAPNLRPKADKKLQILEIGCALGIGLSALKADHPYWEFSGADISEDAERACVEKDIPFYKTDSLGRIRADKKFDVILLFDLIEHLIDIPAFVEFLEIHLKRGGLLVVTTPDMNGILNRVLGKRSPSIKIPQHTIYFDKNTLGFAVGKNFQLLKGFVDFQSVSMVRIMERLRSIFLSRAKSIKSESSLRMWVPNGMKVFVYKKVH